MTLSIAVTHHFYHQPITPPLNSLIWVTLAAPGSELLRPGRVPGLRGDLPGARGVPRRPQRLGERAAGRHAVRAVHRDTRPVQLHGAHRHVSALDGAGGEEKRGGCFFCCVWCCGAVVLCSFRRSGGVGLIRWSLARAWCRRRCRNGGREGGREGGKSYSLGAFFSRSTLPQQHCSVSLLA